MKLRHQVAIAVLAGTAGLATVLYFATDHWVLGGFLASERREAVERTLATTEVVRTMLQEHVTGMTDWAEWDDMARLLAGETPEFAAENLTPSALAALQWDVVLAVRTDDGAVCAEAALDPTRTELAAADPQVRQALLDPNGMNRQGGPTVGLFAFGDTLWLLAAREALHSDRSTPRRPGRFATASRLGEEWVARLAQFTGLRVSLRPGHSQALDASEAGARRELASNLGTVAVQPQDDSTLVSHSWLEGFDGRPTALLRIDRPRPLLAQGRAVLHSALWTLGLGGLLLALGAQGLASVPLRRLGALLRGVAALRAGRPTPVPELGRDELTELTQAFNGMAAQIVDRESRLASTRDRLQLVLDSTGDGLVPCLPDGTIAAGASRRAEQWFGPSAGRKVWDHLFATEAQRVEFELAWSQLVDGILPFELLVDQLPRRCEHQGRHFQLEFRLFGDSSQDGYLVVIRDVTEQRAAEQAEQEAREVQDVVANLLRDPADFERFLDEMQQLLGETLAAHDAALRSRGLHTLKGNAALYGFSSFAELCHRAEDGIQDGRDLADFAAELTALWQQSVERIGAFLPERGEARVCLSLREYEAFLARLHEAASPRQLEQEARTWRYHPIRTALQRLARQTRAVGKRLGKAVEVTVDAEDLRYHPDGLQEFLDTFVHVVRNAIDHGIEATEVRRANGKPERGSLRFGAALRGDEVVITCTDDGAGIDWTTVARKAAERGLPAARHEDLVAALFADGLSTRTEVTSLSGRGVGLAAVQAAVQQLGGSIDVRSKTGLGTTFEFRLPKSCSPEPLAVATA